MRAGVPPAVWPQAKFAPLRRGAAHIRRTCAGRSPRAETLPQRRPEAVLRGYSAGTRRVLEEYLGVLGGYSNAAADGSAWTTVLSKAGGATVRVRVLACVSTSMDVCVHVCARVRVRVQFYGNADPQNQVTNEFAAPVLARSVCTTLGVLWRYPKGARRGTLGVL